MDIVGLFLALVVLLGIATVQSRISQADRRVARVEHKLDTRWPVTAGRSRRSRGTGRSPERG
jgi:hypothetical protein